MFPGCPVPPNATGPLWGGGKGMTHSPTSPWLVHQLRGNAGVREGTPSLGGDAGGGGGTLSLWVDAVVGDGTPS